MVQLAFDAYVGAAVFDGAGRVWFAMGDGTIADGDGVRVAAHEGAILCAVRHPRGVGVLTGGEDGRVVWTRTDGHDVLYTRPGRWIDALASSEASGLWALASGRELEVRDAGDVAFARAFRHERSVTALAFDAKGRRLAAATYGGVVLWYARIAEQTPQMLRWAGSHIELAWTPDGRFLISSMQENALHGWRLADGKDMRMGGYPSKVRSLAFFARGRAMATSGATAAVVWPFAGPDGPMGKAASELDTEGEGIITRVAAAPAGQSIGIGRADGGVRLADVTRGSVRTLRPSGGAPVSALAVSPDGLWIAYGDEAGFAGVSSL